jgi:hypothetical protein
MIDPTKITNYHLSHAELEEQLIWWVFAAGHNGVTTAVGVDKFLNVMTDQSLNELVGHELSPFNNIDNFADHFGWLSVTEVLSKSSLGCWRIKSRTIRELIESDLNLKTCSVEDLENIYGIGPKTARCFVLHTREGSRVAGLDTHLLKFLRDEGYEVPKSTPASRKKYQELEDIFLSICDARNKVPAEYDLEIWNHYSQNKPLTNLSSTG